jgi:TRAP-type C4-dicarboxylate transport system permease small subunit
MSFSLWLIVVIMFLQIVMRYVFNNSLSWPEEFSRYLFIYLAFLGISYAVHTNTHIRMDILETIIPRLKKPLGYIGDIFLLGFCLYLFKPGLKVLKFLIRTNQTSPAMELPMYWVYLALFIGLCLTIFRVIQKYSMSIIKKRKNKGATRQW